MVCKPDLILYWACDTFDIKNKMKTIVKFTNNDYQGDIPLRPIGLILSLFSVQVVHYKLCLTHDLLSPEKAIISPTILKKIK